jgi:hypothetical protein
LNHGDTFLAGAMGTAVERAVSFDPMSNNAAATVIAAWSQGMNSALKAIKGVRFAPHIHGKGFIIIISTNFTLCHF